MANRILLAIDDSDYSRAAANELVAHMRPESTIVVVLHVLELDRMLPAPFDFARGSEYGADVTEHVRASRDHAERLVADVAERLQQAQFRAETRIVEGEPRHAILNCATELDCDCIVMGSHGRRGFDRFFIGSVSESVVRHAHCSVHVVRMPALRRSTGPEDPPPSSAHS
jgi:nucleotide-binding universal stress UspA family protein